MTSSRAAGLIFLSAMSVYAGQAMRANPAFGADGTDQSGVRVIDDGASGAGVASSDLTAVVPIDPPAPANLTASNVRVNEMGLVDLHVSNADLVEVLRMLSLQLQRNIVASKEVRGTITASLFQVTLHEALDAILSSNGYVYREQGSFIYIHSRDELAKLNLAERRLETRVYRLYYTPAADAAKMVRPAMSSQGTIEFSQPGKTGIETDETNGNAHAVEDMIVINDYSENLDQVKTILDEIDRRPQQILVEATILRATLREDNALGVDFTVVGGVDFSTIMENNGQFTAAGVSDVSSGGDDGGTGTGNSFNKGSGSVNSVGTGNSFTQTIPNGFKAGVITNNVSVFVAALESVTDVVVLANPKVLALNKQSARVHVGSRSGYPKATTTETSTVQDVGYLETGTTLAFRPFIGDDGYIRLEIRPKDSSGAVNARNLPNEESTEVTTNIMVKDGRTIVIGGLFREETTSNHRQVPLLGNIPLLGHLFKNQSDTTVRTEVIILLTPHIVKDEARYAAMSEEAMRDAQRMRVGVRQGIMPWGRSRLAELSYDRAVREMANPEPDREKVLWHLNAATNINPRFLEAIRMKEQITSREVMMTDNSSIRSFVRDRILAEQAGKSNPPAINRD